MTGMVYAMKKTAVLSILCVAVLLAAVITEAQQTTKVARLGYLATRSGPGPNDHAFEQGLRELGYLEGQNILIERRWAGGNPDRIPSLAAELVRLKVDMIVTSGSTSTHAAKKATATIPILSWRKTPIPLETDSSPVLRTQVATLLGYQMLTGS